MSGIVKAHWWNKTPNVGDHVTPYLIHKLSDKEPQWVNPNYHGEHIVSTGSIMDKVNSFSTVFGTGFMSLENKFFYGDVKPNILAVRGPQTREMLLNFGLDCPEIYGDPALLLPRVYNPNIDVKYKYGIIPHYVDQAHAWVHKTSARQDTKFINIKTNNVESFLNEMLECEIILSSSLHGIIMAEAYGRKAIWIKLSDNIGGGKFKYQDYYKSVNKHIDGPIMAYDKRYPSIDKWGTMIDQEFFKPIEIDLDKLFDVCPFRS